MADKKLLEILKQGPKAWNAWRHEHPDADRPDLSDADLSHVNLTAANLVYMDLKRAILFGARLSGADLTGALLDRAHLVRADLSNACITCADLTDANLTDADLDGADFSGSGLVGTNLSGAILSETNFDGSSIGWTVFADVDLRLAEGLENLIHMAPSEISISTIYKSEGKIPEAFLLSCGVPESFIAQIPALVGAVQPIQFHSCFISYSSRDEEFAKRLHARTRQEGLRVWFAPEDMKGGRKLFDQIDRAIQVHDRLLLVLSESSMRSKWVEQEIRRARKVEVKEGRQKLFPIRLVSYEELQAWECLDSSSGEDLAEEVRAYYIPDFSNWKSHDDFERGFARLLADLKAAAV